MFDVSIIIPTYNRCGLLSQAIDSCVRQIDDGKIEVQIIVIDDASTDLTYEVLEKYGDSIETMLKPRNEGQAKGRNNGIKKASGRYVKFLDSDDILVDGILHEEISLADYENADIVVSGWGEVEIDDKGRHIAGTEKLYSAPCMEPLTDAVLLGRSPVTSAALYKRSYIEKLEWDPSVRKLDDWDWFVRAALQQGKVISLNSLSYWWRQHSGKRITSSSSMLLNAVEHHKILKKMEEILGDQGELTPHRKKRLAQYYYKELRVLSLYDRDRFNNAVEHIYSLDPAFVPVDEERQYYMRILGRLLGIRRSLLLHSFVKKLLKKDI